jgi:hypothetical protein
MRLLVPGVIVTVLFLSGCAGQIFAADPTHPATVPTPAITESPAPTTSPFAGPTVAQPVLPTFVHSGLSAPKPIFGADCSKVFSLSELKTITGVGMKKFSDEDASLGTDVNRVYSKSKSQSRTVASRLLSRFWSEDLSKSAGAPVAQPAGSWLVVTDCEALRSIVIGGRTVKLATDILGTDASSTPLDDALAGGANSGDCYGKVTDSNGDEGYVSFTAVGGAAWKYDELLDGLSAEDHVEQVVIPGFDFAVHRQSDEINYYCLISGPNYLSATINSGIGQMEALTAIKAKLDAS